MLNAIFVVEEVEISGQFIDSESCSGCSRCSKSPEPTPPSKILK
jgi:NADH:ubiquinone oxidoreductase subunit F (NADH-binding)